MNFEFSNFMAFDSKMMLIELVDNLILSKNDQKYQHMYYQKTEEIPWTMRVQMVSFVSARSISGTMDDLLWWIFFTSSV